MIPRAKLESAWLPNIRLYPTLTLVNYRFATYFDFWDQLQNINLHRFIFYSTLQMPRNDGNWGASRPKSPLLLAIIFTWTPVNGLKFFLLAFNSLRCPLETTYKVGDEYADAIAARVGGSKAKVPFRLYQNSFMQLCPRVQLQRMVIACNMQMFPSSSKASQF